MTTNHSVFSLKDSIHGIVITFTVCGNKVGFRHNLKSDLFPSYCEISIEEARIRWKEYVSWGYKRIA